MPSKCNKVKNPCKICLETVNNKTGLQCQGACRKWVHFSCLHYTPGKIRDIKQGVIKVTCPCPDCKTTAPKEYRTDEPFSCTNIQCPSNLPRSCISNTCPSNQQGSGGPLPLLICEKDTCKQNKSPTNAMGTNVQIIPTPNTGYFPPSSSESTACCGGQSPHVKGDMGNARGGASTGEAIKVMEQICTTVDQLANQINCLMNEMKSLKGGRKDTRRNAVQQDSCNPKPKSCNCPDNPRQY